MNNNNIGMGLADILRFYSLGVINILGIIFPGLLFVAVFSGMIIAPSIIILNDFYKLLNPHQNALDWSWLIKALSSNNILIIIFVVLLSYLIGYILRLWTVDRLDEKSAKNVFDDFSIQHSTNVEVALKKESWPYRGEKHDKFPYLHLKDYLKKRGLNHLAKLVDWENEPFPTKGRQRSKKIINAYKIEVSYKSPMLSAIIESNEAHIRLLYGTWQIAEMFVKFGLISIILCLLLFIALVVFKDIVQIGGFQYFMLATMQTILVFLLRIGKTRIEKLFHYQRVKELVQILVCTHYVRELCD